MKNALRTVLPGAAVCFVVNLIFRRVGPLADDGDSLTASLVKSLVFTVFFVVLMLLVARRKKPDANDDASAR